MSLMNTVTKMAIGFAVAKGMEAMNKKGGIGSVMEGLAGQGQDAADAGAPRQAGGMGGLGDILGQLGGSATSQGQGASGQPGGMGGLGDLLGQLTGGGAGGQGAQGGLGGLLGQLTGGAGGGSSAGGLGGLGGLLGGLAAARGGSGGLEGLLQQDNPVQEPSEDEIAKLMLRAMTQAARADGDIDPAEKAKLLGMLEDGDPSDLAVVQQILEEPVSAGDLATETPKGLETQVYTMSVNAIDPDNQAEAQYLHDLASGLNIAPDTCNKIHDSLGAPRLYR